VKTETVAFLARLLCYGVFASGSLLLFFEKIRILRAKFRMRKRLPNGPDRARFFSDKEAWLRGVLAASLGRPVSPWIFLSLLLTLFLLVLLLCIRFFVPIQALFCSLMAAGLPCLMLFIRLVTVRQKGSYEGERLVNGLLRRYRSSHCNICEAMERLLAEEKELHVTGKLLFSLLLRLRASGDRENIKRAGEEFAFALGTNWGRMLAHNISEAAGKGTDISLALEDIQIQLREAKSAAEERKRLNGESLRMTCVLVPVLYLATVFLSVWYLELPFASFLKNQFATREGLVFFLLIAFLFVGDLGFLTLLVKQKYDY